MKKYLFVVVAIVALVVMASGCTSQTGNNTTATKNYSANGIAFSYPDSWIVINDTSNENITAVFVGDVDFNSTNGTKGNSAVISKLPKSDNATAAISDLKNQIVNGTNSTLTIAGVSANVTSINGTADNVTVQLKVLTFEKNNFLYVIQYITVANGTQPQEGAFDTITKSLQVT
jgi:hypothetical protein